MIDRRTVLKQLGLVASGALILPACDFNPRKVSVALENLSITVEQEDLVKLLVDTIIPASDLPGAQALEVDKFVWVMVDDCLTEEQQAGFKAGMSRFNEYVNSIASKDLEDMEPKQRTSLLTETMAVEAPEPPPLPKADEKEQTEVPVASYLKYIQLFVSIVKSYTIQGYLQSEYIMREVMPYALVPGKIEYCQTIDPTKRINING